MDKLAVIQSEETVAELKIIDSTTKELILTFKSLVEQTDKISSGFGKGTPKELIKAVNDAAVIQKKYENALNDVSKATSELERLKKRISVANTQEGKEISALRLQLQDLNKENKDTAKSMSVLASAYDQLNRKHEVARKNAMDLGVQYGTLSKEFLDAAKVANQYDTKLKQVDATLGKHNRNVGNYNNLQVQLSQVLRETPNFAIDPRIGIMSLTNNIPMLAEAMSDVGKKAKALKEEFKLAAIAAKELAISDALLAGQNEKTAAAIGLQAEAQVKANYQNTKAPSLIKQVMASLFSWQTMLIVGIALITLYSKEVIAWTKSLFGGSVAIDKVKESQKSLAEALKATDFKKAIRDVSEMTNVFQLAREGVVSKEKALKFYNDTLGKVMGSAKDLNEAEMILTKNADNYIKATLYKAAANLALDKSAAEMLKAEEARQKKLEEFNNTFRDAQITQIRSQDDYNNQQKRIANNRKKQQQQEIKDATDAAKAQEDIAKNMMKTAAGFAKGLNFDSLYGKEEKVKKPKKAKGTPSLSKDERDAIDMAIADRDNQIAKIKEQKLKLEITEKQYWESYIQIQYKYRSKILQIINDDNARKTRISAQVRLKAITEIEKANKEIYDYEKSGMDAQKKLQDQNLENRLESIKNNEYILEQERIKQQNDVYNELIANTDKYYFDLIEKAKKYGQEVINIEAARDTKIADLQKSQMGINAGSSSAITKDVAYYRQIEDAYRSAANAEERRLIIENSRLNAREREFFLSLKEKEQTLAGLEVDKKRLQAREEELRLKDKSSELTVKESEELSKIVDSISNINEKLAVTNEQLKQIKLNKLREDWSSTLDFIANGLNDLGFSNLANEVDRTFEEIINKTFDWRDASILAAAAVGDALTSLNQASYEQRIAQLDEELAHSQATTEQELGFISDRLGMLNALTDASKEQIAERNALEDEARVLKEQQLQREKMIATQKAKAEQKAAANQALINGFLAASKTLATLGVPIGIIPAAVAATFGAIQAGLIMSKNPVPQYFVGRKGGQQEIAWTQEKGREMITGKDGTIKSLGNDSGPTLTELKAGDNVHTASETKKMLAEMDSMPKLGENVFLKIARQNVAPIMVQQNKIDYDKLADKIGDKFDRSLKKYDKVTMFEDENGNIFSQEGGKIPVLRGKRKTAKTIIKVSTNERN